MPTLFVNDVVRLSSETRSSGTSTIEVQVAVGSKRRPIHEEVAVSGTPWPGCSASTLPLPSSAPRAFDWVLFGVDETDQGGQDLDGDGQAASDNVVHALQSEWQDAQGLYARIDAL